MESNCKAHHYTTIDAFKRDIEQIRINSEIYNGPPEKSVYTAKAYEIVDCANALIEKNRDQLCELEANMQRAFDEVEDVESMMTGASSVADDFAVDDSRSMFELIHILEYHQHFQLKYANFGPEY